MAQRQEHVTTWWIGRLLRGGNYSDDPFNFRAASRGGGSPGRRFLGYGFRLARSLP
jgi:hypothetical protein